MDKSATYEPVNQNGGRGCSNERGKGTAFSPCPRAKQSKEREREVAILAQAILAQVVQGRSPQTEEGLELGAKSGETV